MGQKPGGRMANPSCKHLDHRRTEAVHPCVHWEAGLNDFSGVPHACAKPEPSICNAARQGTGKPSMIVQDGFIDLEEYCFSWECEVKLEAVRCGWHSSSWKLTQEGIVLAEMP